MKNLYLLAKIIFCVIWGVGVPEKKFQVDQHLMLLVAYQKRVVKVTVQRWKHFWQIDPSQERKNSREKNDFILDLCQAMIGSNIPLN